MEEQKGEITINDIAKTLHISPSTVSRALNNSSKISDETKRKVREVAKDLGYEINLVAASLSKNKTNLIGVIIPKLNSNFFSRALSGIELIAQSAGYKIIICQTNENVQQEIEMTKVMSGARVDGLIACLSMETQNVDHFDVFIRKKIPVVLFDRVNFEIPGPKIVVDNYGGAFQATEHLIKIGCKRIAHLAGPPVCKVFNERANGFRDALKKYGMPLYPQFLLSCDLNEKDASEALELWMELDERPDAIFTANATTGLVINSLAKNYGIKVPDELSLISFGNEPCNEYMTPSLSAVDLPGAEMGRTAATYLLNAIKGKNTDNQLVLKPIQLLIRNSSFILRE